MGVSRPPRYGVQRMEVLPSPLQGFLLTLARMASLRRASVSSEGENDQARVGGLKTSPPRGAAPPKTHPGPPTTLTVQSWHEILQSFAVEGEGGVGVSLLILPHRLHHQVSLEDTMRGSQGLEPPRSQGAAPSPSSPPCPGSRGRGCAPCPRRGGRRSTRRRCASEGPSPAAVPRDPGIPERAGVGWEAGGGRG